MQFHLLVLLLLVSRKVAATSLTGDDNMLRTFIPRSTAAFVGEFSRRRGGVTVNPSRIAFETRPPLPFVSSQHRVHLETQPQTRCFATKNKSFPKNGRVPREDNWKVPDYIQIPEHALEFSFVRSSGAGGQNVNKVNTQVQLRFHVPSAFWMPNEVRQRLQQQQKSRINKEGYFSLSAQEHRTQTANRKEALQKLQTVLKEAWVRPKMRNMRTGISNKTKRERKEFKRRRSQVKEGRRRVDL